MKKYLFLLACFSFLMAHCHKESFNDTTGVEGTVVEFGTKKPIPNVLLLLNKSAGLSGSWSSSWSTLDTFRTDANGHYRYTFKHEAGGNYELVLRLPPLYAGYVYGNVENGRLTKKEFVLDPPGWLKVRVQNVNPYNSNDTLIIWGVGPLDKRIRGNVVDSTFITPHTIGNRYGTIYYVVVKNGIRNQRQDSIYCPSHDTAFINIKY
jgi:hypothetical protein